MTDTQPCRAVKHGAVDLTCSLPDDHEPEWHESDYVHTEHRTVEYPGARHIIETTTREHVEWEPIDHAKEATRMLLKDRRRDRDAG